MKLPTSQNLPWNPDRVAVKLGSNQINDNQALYLKDLILALNKIYADVANTVNGNVGPLTWVAPTLQNSWVDYGTPFEIAGYSKDEAGIVRLHGLVKNGTGAANEILFTLPSGYRPSNDQVFNQAAAGPASTDMRVLSDGSVTIGSGVSSTTWLSISGIQFEAA